MGWLICSKSKSAKGLWWKSGPAGVAEKNSACCFDRRCTLQSFGSRSEVQVVPEHHNANSSWHVLLISPRDGFHMCKASVERLTHHTPIQRKAERFISSRRRLLVWWGRIKCSLARSVEVGEVSSTAQLTEGHDQGLRLDSYVWFTTSLGLINEVLQYHWIIHEIISFSPTKYFSPLLLTFILSVSQFRALAPMYYRGSAAAIIVYDITKEVFIRGIPFIMLV